MRIFVRHRCRSRSRSRWRWHKKGVNLISRFGEFVHNWQLALTIATYMFAQRSHGNHRRRSGHHLTRSTYSVASTTPGQQRVCVSAFAQWQQIFA